MPVRSKLDECQRVNECIAKHDRSLFIIARKMKCTVQRIWEVYSRDVHGNGISNGTGNPMGMGIKHRIGNGNGRYWNYLHSHGNLFPKVLCCDEHIYVNVGICGAKLMSMSTEHLACRFDRLWNHIMVLWHIYVEKAKSRNVSVLSEWVWFNVPINTL